MLTTNYKNLPIYDYRGKPLKLTYEITYKMTLKDGYILALRPGQHITNVPNLLKLQRRRA
ncbi:hypothetical protein ACNAN0_00530 [Agrilactobacillus fermenti]|uniref:hypothetical protein n=1 Tax=Agrilactobacillus fermenti TaxID=2586909 RepID=UPI001E5707D7|nr:hypothetical protein [Agrilactobacillus fermenti]MCD2255574.1 hypothetical protein [Agrilactobacillus fermenti]